jgi:uncharacterized protein YaaW (UPF0174 family)
MAYRQDDDLEFLRLLQSEDLEDLVYCLTHDKDGSLRLTEELTANPQYKKFGKNYHQYWEDIAGELQCFGANSLAIILRGGKGVKYKEILVDVCDKMKVNYNKKSSTEKIEENLMLKILEDALAKMTPEELKEIALTVGSENTSNITKEAMFSIFQAIFRAGGFKSYQLTLIIVNAIAKALIGRGLSFGGNILLTRTMAILAGPIGWAITALWTAIDVAGPAYRVTIPACLIVATLRKKYEMSTEDVIKIEKYEKIIIEFEKQIIQYQSSDKKLFGLCLFAWILAYELRSEDSFEDIQSLIYGIDGEAYSRAVQLFDNTSLPKTLAQAITFSIDKCNCTKESLDTVFLYFTERANNFDGIDANIQMQYKKIIDEVLI